MKEENNVTLPQIIFVSDCVSIAMIWVLMHRWPWYQFTTLSHYVNANVWVGIVCLTVALTYVIAWVEYYRFRYVNTYAEAVTYTGSIYFKLTRHYIFSFGIIFLLIFVLNVNSIPTKYQIEGINLVAILLALTIIWALVKFIGRLCFSLVVTPRYFIKHMNKKEAEN